MRRCCAHLQLYACLRISHNFRKNDIIGVSSMRPNRAGAESACKSYLASLVLQVGDRHAHWEDPMHRWRTTRAGCATLCVRGTKYSVPIPGEGWRDISYTAEIRLRSSLLFNVGRIR